MLKKCIFKFPCKDSNSKKWNSLKDKWFDTEYQVNTFIDSLKKRSYLGETFPIFWPNLGPNVYAGFYGTKLEFGEVTSWESEPIINNWDELDKLNLNWQNTYIKKIEEITKYALEKSNNKFMVGYTDLHPGLH